MVDVTVLFQHRKIMKNRITFIAIFLFVIVTLSGFSKCLAPPTTTTRVPLGTSVTISWSKNICANGYKIRYRPLGTNTWKYKIVSDTNKTTIYFLNYSTDYQFSVASISGTIISSYSFNKTFRTLCECFNPIVVIDSIGTNGVKFYIDDDSCGTRYRIQYRIVGKAAWVTKIVGDTVNTLVVTGLAANTPYEFRARRECNLTGTYTSTWNVISPFNTNLRVGFNEDDKTVIKTVDVLGREISPTSSGIVIYIYSDGSISRKYNVEK